MGNPTGAIAGAKKAVSSVGSILGVKSSPVSTAGIQSQSSLAGQLTTAGGKQVPIKLPSTVATKQDIQILQGAIQKINAEISKVASTTTNTKTATVPRSYVSLGTRDLIAGASLVVGQQVIVPKNLEHRPNELSLIVVTDLVAPHWLSSPIRT